MGFVEPDIQKERLVGATLFIQPRDSFVNNNPASIAFDFADRSAIANKVHGILVAWLSVVSRGKPVIKSMVTRRRLVFFSCRQTQMSFTEMRSCISVTLENLR